MKTINLGLIGLGYIGNTHLRHSLSLNDATLVGVSDVSKKALARAKKMGVKNTYSDYHQLLKNQDVDAVIIALPTHLHKSCVFDAIEAGKDVLLEKPLARNPEEGRAIVRIAEKQGRKLMVGYHLRFAPQFRGLKEQLIAGSLGEVQTAIGTFVGTGPMIMHRSDGHSPRPVPTWWLDKNLTGGGVLMDLGCHVVNLLRWYLGEVLDIRSYLGYRFNLDVEDHAMCVAKFASERIAVVNVGWFSLGHQLKIDLFGTANAVSVEIKPPNKVMHALQLLTGTSKFYLPHLLELQHFVSCLRNDITPSPSGIDALRDLEAISKAYANQIEFLPGSL
jgi:UDP-N-acetylglucosamine 3-dehydrogenase